MPPRDGREIVSATPFSVVYPELEQLDQQCVSLAVPSTPPVKRAHYRLVIHADEHLRSPQHVRVSGTKVP